MSSSSTFSYSSQSFSSSTTSQNGQRAGQAYVQTTRSNPDGTTVMTHSQNLGEPAVQDTRHYDSAGRPIQGLEGSGNDVLGRARIEDVTDEQDERDRKYGERIEDEYAKREGGA